MIPCPLFSAGVNLYSGRGDYSTKKKYLQLECNVYDVADEKRIVSGVTRLKPVEGMKALTGELAEMVLGELKSNGMLP